MLSKLIHQMSRDQILRKIDVQKNRTLQLLQPYINGKLTGYECTPDSPHPLLFELGHISLFYDTHFIRYYNNNYIRGIPFEPIHTSEKKYANYDIPGMFDSLVNPPEERINTQFIPFDLQLEYYNDIMKNLSNYFKHNKTYSPEITYVIQLCLLHNTMHDEVLLFLQHLIHGENPLLVNSPQNLSKYIKKKTSPTTSYTNNTIFIPGGTFKQGRHLHDGIVVFDNERPQHIKKVKSFFCYEYPVNNYEYLQFINAGGYTTPEYWSREGLRWLKQWKKGNITDESLHHPKYWFKKNGKWYRQNFNQCIELKMNEPVVNVNFYEAEAYANYMGGRLPTETEYEYLSTNGGETEFPWGNDELVERYANVNYAAPDVISLNKHSYGENKWGIKHLLGNCWYWTNTRFYPYSGFEIDPVYKTFSYPFFYSRYIVKGAAWSCGRDLVYPQYRNSQEPYKRFHYTGIRVVKDL